MSGRRMLQAACVLSIALAAALLAIDREPAKPGPPARPEKVDRLGEYASIGESRRDPKPDDDSESETALEDAPSDDEEVVAPSLPALREEVEQDSESTPPSLVRFASAMAPRIARAIADEDQAKQLFPALEECARATESGRAVQAFCLSNAAELANVHASLAERYRKLYDKTDPKVIELMELTGM